jgi:hypothetical protein
MTLQSKPNRRRQRLLNAVGAAAFLTTMGGALYWTFLRPQRRRWGAAGAEVAQTLPGDQSVAGPRINATRDRS